MAFLEELKVELQVKVGEASHDIPGGNIKRLSVKAHSHGFTATVEWWIVCQQSASEDELFADFIKTDLTEVTLKMDRSRDTEGEEASPLELKGLVEERWVRERAFERIADAPVLQRRYRVRFADRASVLWRQHFPSGVWVDQSLQEVIEANKPPGVTLTFAWEGASTKYPLHALGLGAPDNTASFRDFLHWVQAEEKAGLFFDTATGEYALRDSKPEGGEATELPLEDVAELEVHFPELRRDQVVVLNSYVDASTRKKEVANELKAEGVRQEYLITSAVENDLTARATLEEKLQKAPEPGIRVRFQRYPSVTVAPNALFSFGDDWSTGLFTNGKQYRMYHLSIDARAKSEDPSDNLEDDVNEYHLEVTAELELEADTTFRRPAFTRPHWPFHAEGRIVSEVGEDEDLTYQAKQDEDTSLEYFRVKLPLWEDKQVLAPYNPGHQPGHFYFPVDKNARVLVSLEFRRAFLKRFLEWRPGAKLPKETQGNHLLLGKKAASETSIQHIYQDAKPLLKIARTSDKDIQLVEISEGRIFLEAKEKEE
ncbi:hypothetical protein P2318_13415 [Myxococcaceae bacterium GXIMD 01537]